MVSRCTGCSALLPIVHFNCAPHKKQKYLLGTHSVSHTYKLTQFLILSYAQPITAQHTDARSTLELSLSASPTHTGTLRRSNIQISYLYWKQNKDILQTEAKCVFLPASAILMFLMSWRTSDWKRLGISK